MGESFVFMLANGRPFKVADRQVSPPADGKLATFQSWIFYWNHFSETWYPLRPVSGDDQPLYTKERLAKDEAALLDEISKVHNGHHQ